MSRLSIIVIISAFAFIGATGYFWLKGLSNLATNVTSVNNEIGQFPINFQDSNSLAVVCAQPSDEYDCNYYGVSGLQTAINNGGRDHTVYVRAGTYNITSTIRIENQDRYITIIGDGIDKTIFNASSLNNSAIYVEGDLGFSLKQLTLQGNKNYNQSTGVSLYLHPSVTLEKVLIQEFNKGVTYQNVNTLKIRNSYFYSNRIGLAKQHTEPVVSRVEVYNSVFTSSNIALNVTSNSKDFFSVVNNTFYNNGTVFSTDPPEYSVVVNNIFANTINNVFAIYNSTAQPGFPDYANNFNLKVSYNLFYQGGTCVIYMSSQNNTSVPCDLDDTNLYNLDPRFVDTNVIPYNLRLQSNSPAINAGDPLITDINGSRSDIGAYGGPGACLENLGCKDVSPGVPGSTFNTDVNEDGKTDVLDVIETVKGSF